MHTCWLDLKMLGGFSIKANGVPCEINMKRSKQVLMLIEYMIVHRFSKTASQQFTDILWGDQTEGKEVDNPGGALKNLVWRSRKALREALPAKFSEDLIVFTGNTYHFNNSYRCTVDIEELERCFVTLSTANLDEKDRIPLLEEAVELYGGDFLPDFSEFEWVDLLCTYYKRIFVTCVNELLTIYIGNDLFEKAILLSETALKHEKYDEQIHAAYITALAGINRVDMATIHYEHVVKVFYRDLGVSVSPELSHIYQETRHSESNAETSIHQIVVEIDENPPQLGGYYCSFEVLKNIYRVINRTAQRDQQCVSILVLTVQNELALQKMTEFMEQLEQCISSSIRMADCFTRYSFNQYLILLPRVDNSTIDLIKKRISKAVGSINKKKEMSLSYTFVEKAHPEDLSPLCCPP